MLEIFSNGFRLKSSTKVLSHLIVISVLPLMLNIDEYRAVPDLFQ